jgi:hypothetical protein
MLNGFKVNPSKQTYKLTILRLVHQKLGFTIIKIPLSCSIPDESILNGFNILLIWIVRFLQALFIRANIELTKKEAKQKVKFAKVKVRLQFCNGNFSVSQE